MCRIDLPMCRDGCLAVKCLSWNRFSNGKENALTLRNAFDSCWNLHRRPRNRLDSNTRLGVWLDNKTLATVAVSCFSFTKN